MRKPTRFILKNFIWLIILLGISQSIFGQDIPIRKIEQQHIDSLKNSDYPFVLPIYGDRVQKMGHDLPLPFGIMVNYISQDNELTLTNLELKLNDSDFIPMEFIQFDKIKSSARVVNVRLDAWLFPFLNVYGLYARAQTDNLVPLVAPFQFDIPTTPTADTYGVGTVLAYGSGKYFAIANTNFTWSNISSLDGLVFGTVSNFKIGRSFAFQKRFHNINLSLGVQHQHLQRNSSGSLSISEMFSQVDQAKLQEIKDDINSAATNWYDNLGPAQKVLVNQIVGEIQDWLDGRTPGNSELGYRFDKDPLGEFSFQIGVQYNHGRKWWYRLETGIGRGRTQILVSANYRFGL
ncbi:hypothetical protein HX109_03615 [Galbibacter sp. BG1]|uniref:hypothetical protein n=1 Tax=Galbibacter sp. BG1 TaxID=1170699 RepID=UPI0015B9430C|nr:hypothetical protein [Galbibacter sp. BG1]QLE00693.1 hypothetical protein HX109_03615 [Galbibacter sp. BG1]